MAKFKKIAAGLLVIAAAVTSCDILDSNSVEAPELVARKSKESVYSFLAIGERVDTLFSNNANFALQNLTRDGEVKETAKGLQSDSTFVWQMSNGETSRFFETKTMVKGSISDNLGFKLTYEVEKKAEKMIPFKGKVYKETDIVLSSTYAPEQPGELRRSLENMLVVLDEQPDYHYEIENEAYNLNLVAEGSRAYADVQKNSWDMVVYDYDTEVSRQGNSVDLALSAEASKPASITVSKADLGQLSLRTLTHGANHVSKRTVDDVEVTETTLDYVATFNGGNNVTISTLAESAVRGDESLKSAKVQNVRFVGVNVTSQTDANATIALNFDVDFETPNVATKAASSVVTKTITVNQEQVANDELIRRWGEGEEKVDGSNISVTAKFYEEWTLTGVKLVNTQNGTMKATLKAQEGDDVVSSNINFTTTSNGQAAGTYSSTASNGEKSFNNNYTYTFDESKTFTYEGIEVKFEGKFTVSEVETTIGTIPATKVIDDITYDAYPYLNKVQGVYTIGAASVTLTAEADRNLLIEREIPKVIPEGWGKIQSMGVAMVPAHSISGGFADGSSTQYRHKGFCLVCENGAVATVTTMKTIVPAIESIVNGNYVAGDFTGCITAIDTDANGDWNGNGVWYPATVSDSANLIQYFYKGQLHRSLTDKSMSAWGWNEKTSYIGGYEFSVNKKGVLTVRYNGQVVMQIR